MILFSAIFVALLATSVLSKSIDENKDLDLKLVHVIFRHGARTPADTYPNDPYKNFDFKPYGWGQLTNKGKLQMFDVGKYLRTRYDSFLGKEFKITDVHAQATDVTRTKMSLQLVMAGLFPPNSTPLEWNKELDWLPIPYSYEPLAQDSLLLVRNSCPRYHEELERVLSQDVAKEIAENSQLFAELSKLTGLTVKSPDDVQDIFSTLQAEEQYGVKLPEWTKDYYPDKLRPLTDKSFVYNTYNDELKRLKGGVFVKKSIEDWEKKASDNLKTKIFLYGGHDSTISNVLSALNVWEAQLPSYGITTMFELSQSKLTGKYGVEIFLRNSTTVEPFKLTIPGCSDFCLVDDLKVLLDNTIPKEFGPACKPKQENFTEPPAGGPSPPTTSKSAKQSTNNAALSLLVLLFIFKFPISISTSSMAKRNLPLK